jgi:hypothetical protein
MLMLFLQFIFRNERRNFLCVKYLGGQVTVSRTSALITRCIFTQIFVSGSNVEDFIVHREEHI